MKRQILFFFGLIISISLLADVPQGISHQAVMRDAENNLIVESPIGLKVSILQGAHDGDAVYVETHNVMTNKNGLITYIIGEGDVIEGVFGEIDWGAGPYWLETKADPIGGEDYSITGVTKFFSVPYSMYAEFAGHAETFAGLDALLARIEALEEALEIVDPTLYHLHLLAYPPHAGTVTGYGEYEEGDEVTIAAIANEGWEFINWTDDADVVISDVANFVYTMPAANVTLIANFQEEESDIIYGDGVTDIDGNEYVTVIIGDQEWMAENLRVTRYNNEDDIPTGLNDEDWEDTTEGAYAIFDHNHEDADGIDSPEAMVEAYGKLYNWYAVDDSRGLCPQDWSVPSDDDWTQLELYICNALGNSDCETHFPYDNTKTSWRGTNEGNALKSCRQVGSPLEECNISEHPRWDSDDTHYGFDEFGFSALPGGTYSNMYYGIGWGGNWWSSSEYSSTIAYRRLMMSTRGDVARFSGSKELGFSVRCVRDIVRTEDE